MACNLETLTLRKGDSSDFFYNIKIPIIVEEGSTIDLTGWKAILQIGSYREVYDNITSKELEVILNADTTINFDPGIYTAYLQFKTSDNKIGTTRPLFKLEIIEEVINARG